MFLCYVDESGDEQPLRTSTDPPVLVIGGLVVSHLHAKSLIWEFLQLKKKYNPNLVTDDTKLSELIAFEVKGSNIRSDLRSASRRRRRRAYGLIDDVLDLLNEYDARVIGEIHIKGELPLNRWVYSNCIANLASEFETRLNALDEDGLMILDARTKNKNVPSVQRVTTKRFKSGGDRYAHLVESPVFGHSDAHVILQLADLIVSAVLFPLACAGFCLCLIDNVHPNTAYLDVRARYGHRVRLLERRYTVLDGRRIGGVRVIDHMNLQPTLALFQEVPFAIVDRPLIGVPRDSAEE